MREPRRDLPRGGLRVTLREGERVTADGNTGAVYRRRRAQYRSSSCPLARR
ncbi:MAG: hypothetical protein MZV49_24015 [Rhodopseudomonas palustris]|nr:hypothetical protein [Rhodopseudomonas palustris]